MRAMSVPARFTPLQSSLLVILFMQRTALVCPSLSSWLSWQLTSDLFLSQAYRLPATVSSSAFPLVFSPTVSPLAGSVRLDRIPIALTVCGPRLRSTGFKRPAGQGEECTSCFIRRAD